MLLMIYIIFVITKHISHMPPIESITANIKFIKELDFSRFDIPPYQRPYRWTEENVSTLLNCIHANIDKEEYRIGSIIVHEDNGRYNIVDGQQRLTTLSLLFLSLDKDTPYKLSCTYNHLESKQNIYRNHKFINKWLNSNKDKKEEIKDFVVSKCSVVMIVVKDLSEAFQMFDSQNGRGKELKGHDLLKAFHLRAMDNSSNLISISDEKIEIDRNWETSNHQESVSDNYLLLEFIVNDLYRTRLWSRKNNAWPFSKQKIKEFKGIQLKDGKAALPLHNQSLLTYLYHMSTEAFASRTKVADRSQNPFVSINMNIVNGKLFFVYVQTYVAAYTYLFKTRHEETDLLFEFQKDFQAYCLGYYGHTRDGDEYIRDVYIALIIALYDRFGEEYVAKYYKNIYILAYKKRLELKSIYKETVAKYPSGVFATIALAVDEHDLSRLRNMAYEEIQCRKLGPKERDIARFMVESGAKIAIRESDISLNGKNLKMGHTLTIQDF